MPFGYEGDEPVAEQGPYDEVVPLLGARRSLVPEGEGHIAVALAQQTDGLRRFGLLKGDAGAGVLGAQGGESGGDEGGAAAGKGDEPDPAGPQPRDGGDLLLGRGESGEDPGRVPHQRLARLRQAHLAPGADEQGRADGRLQGLHLLADGGLGAAQLAPGGGEGSGGGDGTQDAEMTGLDHSSSISGPWGARPISRRRFGVWSPSVRP